MRLKTPLFRAAALISTFALALPTFAMPVTSIADSVQQWAQSLGPRPGQYTDEPTPPRLGNQRRDPKHRGGLWTDKNLEDMGLDLGTATASIDAVPSGHTLSVQADPGSTFGWEGKFLSPFGSINSGNGDKLTQIKLFDWKQRGGFPIDFTLYHNSESSYACELGHNWTWSFDLYINTTISTATM